MVGFNNFFGSACVALLELPNSSGSSLGPVINNPEWNNFTSLVFIAPVEQQNEGKDVISASTTCQGCFGKVNGTYGIRFQVYRRVTVVYFQYLHQTTRVFG